MSVPSVDAILGDLDEVERELKKRMCAQVRAVIEKMRRKPTYPMLKPFIRAYLGELISECGVEL